MSVLKSRRKQTDFKVITNFMDMRTTISKLMFRNFGYKPDTEDPDADFKEWLIGA